MSEQRPLHRLFGLTWIDLFDGTGVEVDPEIDLSIRQQFVDLVFTRAGQEPLPAGLPDGFDDLAKYTLVTFKSHQEALDPWALFELLAHYVNFRKQRAPDKDKLPPESDFRLVAVCVRTPQNLLDLKVPMSKVSEGVYDIPVLTLKIRVVVVHELPERERNAMLCLFSARQSQVQYGREHYRPRSGQTSTVLFQLFQAAQEVTDMDKRIEEFAQETYAMIFKDMSDEDRRRWFPPEVIMKTLSPEERLKGLPAEERLKGLPAEERLKGLPAEERLKGLSPEEVFQSLPPELRAAVEAGRKALGADDSSSK